MPDPILPINRFASRLQEFNQSAIKDTNVGQTLK